MKKIFFAALAMAVVLPAAAQDTYESARLLGGDLNGTARYVGMGGAMEALGADISTTSSNPAGIGLFRHSTMSAGFGLVSQADAKEFDGRSTTNMSFDQAGFVYSMRMDRSSFLNFAFNYHKSRNFNQILSVADHAIRNASSNAITAEKDWQGYYSLGVSTDGYLLGYKSPTSSQRTLNFSQLDYLNANVLADEVPIEENERLSYDLVLYGMDADAYNFDRAHRGWINEFDFTLSGNSDDRFYWGVTVGIYDVKYKGYSEYTEGLRFTDGTDGGIVSYGDYRKINGTGVDMKFGIIARPVEYSPFRIGLYVNTPTWYDLTTENTTALINQSALGSCLDGTYIEGGDIDNSYKFRFYTPWKFGLSLGHTIGKNLALGATYEFSDYGASQNRVKDGQDDWGYEDSYKDNVMKQNTEDVLKGVSTLKVGLEYKPIPELALRAGYNYISAAYAENGVRDQTLDSYGVMYASTSDYVNWKATNRFTAGIGCKVGNMNLDASYQYSTTDGDFYPFQPNIVGGVAPASVSNKRHQVLFTLGYTF
jgi:hypothetical protein